MCAHIFLPRFWFSAFLQFLSITLPAVSKDSHDRRQVLLSMLIRGSTGETKCSSCYISLVELKRKNLFGLSEKTHHFKTCEQKLKEYSSQSIGNFCAKIMKKGSNLLLVKIAITFQ